MSRITASRHVLIAAALGLLALGAGIGWAAVPDSAGVIHGCRNANGGLRIIDTDAGGACGAGEIALNWSQSGPAGPAGAAGPQGPAGAQGPAGPSGSAGGAGTASLGRASWFDDPVTAPAPLTTLPHLPDRGHARWRTLDTLRLTTGKYIVFARVNVQASIGLERSYGRRVRCKLFQPGSTGAVRDWTQVNVWTGGDSANVFLMAPTDVSRAAATTLQLQCLVDSRQNPAIVDRVQVEASGARITAIRVGDLVVDVG